MPRAVIDVTPQRYDLKTCPEGFVTLKRMSYDKWLHRADITMQMQIEMQERQQRGRRNAPNKQHVDIAFQNRAVALYEFAQCIVEHNLEDEKGNLLDFRDAKALQQLDPQVGGEIGDLINELHEPPSEEDQGNS